MLQNLPKLEDKIHLKFKSKLLLENVFVHRSYLNENKNFHLPPNEKLEFLGDSVLSLITSIYLYKNYPRLHEGEYTDIKASIVKTQSLHEAASKLALGEYLYLSKGEELGGGRSNSNILADCFEALIAAVFIDQGFDAAYDFVIKYLFRHKLDYIIKNRLYLSAKSKLQEYCQGRYRLLPVYKLIEEQGPEHKRVFKVGVILNGQNLGIGTGKSKKEAEEKAAEKALKNI